MKTTPSTRYVYSVYSGTKREPRGWVTGCQKLPTRKAADDARRCLRYPTYVVRERVPR